MSINLTSFQRTVRTTVDLGACTDLLDELEWVAGPCSPGLTPQQEREREVLKDAHEHLSFMLECENHGYLFH